MDVRQIECFLALADELHFTRAAARVHLAQPSFSQQIQRLEQGLGVRLVERSSRPVRLTPAGAKFRDDAREGLELLRQAAERARELGGAGRGSGERVALSYVHAAGQLVIPKVVSALQEHASFRLLELWTDEQIARVHSGEVDVAFVFGAPQAPGLASRIVASERFAAILPDDHPLATSEELRLSNLRDQPCILFRRERSPVVFDALMAAASRAHVDLTIGHEVDDPGAVALLANSGRAIGIASIARAAQSCGNGLVARPLTEPEVTVEIHAVWDAGATGGSAGSVLEALGAA